MMESLLLHIKTGIYRLRKFFLITVMFFCIQQLSAQQSGYSIQTIPFAQVSLTDNFWSDLVLPMDVRKVVANDLLAEDKGKPALQRAPIMYCAEWKDNVGKATNLIVPADTKFISTFQPGLLNGVMVLQAEVPAVIIGNPNKVSMITRTLTAIP